MPTFLFKRVVHRAEYYRVEGQDRDEAYEKIENKLDVLEDELTRCQEASLPTHCLIPLAGNDHIEHVEALPGENRSLL